jgi:hypothetical protein
MTLISDFAICLAAVRSWVLEFGTISFYQLSIPRSPDGMKPRQCSLLEIFTDGRFLVNDRRGQTIVLAFIFSPSHFSGHLNDHRDTCPYPLAGLYPCPATVSSIQELRSVRSIDDSPKEIIHNDSFSSEMSQNAEPHLWDRSDVNRRSLIQGRLRRVRERRKSRLIQRLTQNQFREDTSST